MITKMMLAGFLGVAMGSYAASPWLSPLLAQGHFAYGGKTNALVNAANSGAILEYSGDPAEYSGFQMETAQSLDLRGRDSLALEFRVRTTQSGEPLFVGLQDSRTTGPERYYTRLPLSNFVAADTGWQSVRIPLTAFSSLGEYWNMQKKAGEDGMVDWANIRGLRIASDPELGRTLPVKAEISGLDLVTIKGKLANPTAVAGPKTLTAKDLRTVFFDGNILHGSDHYTYGERTSLDLAANSSAPGRFLLTLALDDRDYSGATLLLPQVSNVLAQKGKLALSFFVRAENGPAAFDVTLTDDDSAGKNRAVTTHVRVQDFAKVQGDWVRVTIRLSSFPNDGTWWNTESKTMVPAKFDWAHLRGVRISSDRQANVHSSKDGLKILFLDQIALVDAP